MLKKSLSLFLLLFLINCGGGGGGGDDSGTGPSNDPPVASFSANPLSGSAPLTVIFVSTSTNTTTHDWDFNGDGVLDASGTSVSYTYNDAGSYTVSLTATGPNGVDTLTRTNYVTVSPSPPVALFSAANTTTGKKDLRVEFTNESIRYSSSSWNFGDGNSSSDTNPIHTYTTSGTFDVSLSVTGDAGTDTFTSPGLVIVEDVQTPAFVFDPKYLEVSSGSSFSLDVKVLGVTGLAAAQVTINYDSSLMTYDSVSSGDFLQGDTDPLLVTTSNPGINRLIIYTSSLSSDLPSNDGDGVIATVNFTLNGSVDNYTAINLNASGNFMLDVDGGDITVNDAVEAYLIMSE